MQVYVPDLTLLQQYWLSGDFIGFFFALLTLQFGQLIWGIFIFAGSYVLYSRTQNLLYCVVVWMVVGGIFEVLIPFELYNIGHVFIVLGIGGLIINLYMRVRQQ